jgi:RNA-binding protein
MTAPPKLGGKQLRFLRALAHDKKPLVQIGKHGLSDASIAQLDRALLDHELVKAKVLPECPEDRDDIGKRIGEALGAHVAQTIGATLVLYRPHPKEPQIVLPRSKKQAES